MSLLASAGIIGTGWVGSSVAISVLQAGIVKELLLTDARPGLAEGEAMDLTHGSSFYPSALVRSAGVEDMLGCDAIVICAGRNGGPEQTRLDLLKSNAELITDLAARLRGYAGIVVMVTNPVDVLTALFTRASGLPPERVMGTGTMLDTARLRQVLSRELHVHPRSVHAQVIGEHGDSEVTLWSGAEIGGVPLRRWPGWTPEHEARIADTVRKAAYEIIRRKGATNHAIGLVTAALLRALLRDERTVLTVSTLQSGALGMAEVALSLPAIVGGAGVVRVLEPLLEPAERAALEHSAQVLRRSLQSVSG